MRNNHFKRNLYTHRMIKALLATGFIVLAIAMYWQYPHFKALESSSNTAIPSSLIVLMPIWVYIALSFGIVFRLNQNRLWKTAPEIRRGATLMKKENPIRISSPRVITPTRGAEISASYIQGDFFLHFQTDTGRHYKFEVEREAFERCFEGDVGTLTYKEKRGMAQFIAFEAAA